MLGWRGCAAVKPWTCGQRASKRFKFPTGIFRMPDYGNKRRLNGLIAQDQAVEMAGKEAARSLLRGQDTPVIGECGVITSSSIHFQGVVSSHVALGCVDNASRRGGEMSRERRSILQVCPRPAKDHIRVNSSARSIVHDYLVTEGGRGYPDTNWKIPGSLGRPWSNSNGYST
jgi:hypothetical protein